MVVLIKLAAAIVVGAARMAAHVHHGQDIVAGVLIAVVAVGIASTAWRWVGPRMPQRLTEPNSAAQKASAPHHEGTT
jgi:membrane-associated phospholipid phosphatase